MLEQHHIKSGLTSDDYICQPRDSLEEGLPVHYNDASGEGETESMYNWNDGWDMGAAYIGDAETEDYEEIWFGDDETEYYWEWDESEYDETEYDDMAPDFMDVYGTDAGEGERIEYETDEEGFIIMR